MRPTALAFLLLFLLPSVVPAAEPPPRLATGELMPPLQGDLLSGQEAVLPAAARGKVALLALGFSYDSRFPVEAWCGRFRSIYGGRADVTLYEVPMLGGGARIGRWFIDSGMRRNTPRELHDNVLTVYGGTGPWKARLGVTDEDLAYLVLLDRDGRVAWQHAGMFDAARFDELQRATDALLAP
jgi:hypothetical protein